MSKEIQNQIAKNMTNIFLDTIMRNKERSGVSISVDDFPGLNDIHYEYIEFFIVNNLADNYI